MWYPSQSKKRNTECVYGIADGRLSVAGQEIETHPAFENVQQFEDWCNRYIAEHDAAAPGKTYRWAVFNRKGERMYQFPLAEYEDDARRIVNKARERYPDAGMHCEYIEI